MASLPSSKGRPTRIALLLSLGLNIFFAAYLATQFVGDQRRPFAVPSPARVVALIESRLPAADAKILRGVYQSREADIAATAEAYTQALNQAVEVIARPDLDPATLRTAVEKARAERLRRGDLTLEILIEALPRMSAAGRQKLVGPFRDR